MSKKDDLARIAELEEDLKRTHADMFNIRRRADEDRVKIGTYAKTEVILQILPVIDNLDRAITNTPEDLKKSEYVKGLYAVQKQLQTTLSSLGIAKIKTVGEVFNPHTMEAVSVAGNGNQEVVSEEVQAGYIFGNQVIRHATVKIEKK